MLLHIGLAELLAPVWAVLTRVVGLPLTTSSASSSGGQAPLSGSSQKAEFSPGPEGS